MTALIEKKQNKRGTWFAVLEKETDLHAVYKLCENYDSNCKGGIRKTWRIVKDGLSFADAFDLFDKRIQGTQK